MPVYVEHIRTSLSPSERVPSTLTLLYLAAAQVLVIGRHKILYTDLLCAYTLKTRNCFWWQARHSLKGLEFCIFSKNFV
nr:hypothetical protein CFP56_54042 [Quercus suber]